MLIINILEFANMRLIDFGRVHLKFDASLSHLNSKKKCINHLILRSLTPTTSRTTIQIVLHYKYDGVLLLLI